jgi:hypothetical protein
MSARRSMVSLRSLLLRLGIAVVATAVLVGVLRIAGQTLHPSLPLTVMLVVALCTWLLSPEVQIADALAPPQLDDDPEAVSPHASDVAVRRAEEMMHGAAPRRRMTSRALGRSLSLAAEEHDRRSESAPLPEDLRDFLAVTTAENSERERMPPVPRRTLHRWLRALAPDSPTTRTSHQEDPR